MPRCKGHASAVMIPTLRIEKNDQAEYHGRIRDGRELLGEVWQPTIADVIGEAARHFQPARMETSLEAFTKANKSAK